MDYIFLEFPNYLIAYRYLRIQLQLTPTPKSPGNSRIVPNERTAVVGLPLIPLAQGTTLSQLFLQ